MLNPSATPRDREGTPIAADYLREGIVHMQGYYRWPTVHGSTIVFGSEDDLWSVPLDGGEARRLTANLAITTQPFFSPDGSLLAFSAREEGHLEVYVMSGEGGPMRRLTYLGTSSTVIGWSPDGTRVFFTSDARQPFSGIGAVMSQGLDETMPREEPYGLAVSITFGPQGGVAIGRHSNDPARWKRYRGGTAGDIWIDPDGGGEFRPLIRLSGNMARPMWIGERVYFLSDHEGIGNIYSCLPDGTDVRRHTNFADFYVRYPATDGRSIVFHAGGDLYVLDVASDAVRKVEVEYHSPRVQRQRRFVEASRYLEGYAIHPKGGSLAITARGKCAAMGNWEGPVTPVSSGDPETETGARYRCAAWLRDGKRVVAVVDRGGEERLEIHEPGTPASYRRFSDLELGRIYGVTPSPTADAVMVWNNRRELWHVELEDGNARLVDRNEWGRLGGAEWAPDGGWVAYHAGISHYRTAIKLWNVQDGTIHQVTDPVLDDASPCFDPDGKYLFFIGKRDLNPVYDNLHFDLGFPRGQRPFLVTLRKDVRSPFAPLPEEGEPSGDEPDAAKEARPSDAEKMPPSPVVIDLDGIQERVVGFPVPEGIVAQIRPLKGKLLFLTFPVEGALEKDWLHADGAPKGVLHVYDLKERSLETLVSGVSDFDVSQDRTMMVYRVRDRLRVVKAGVKPEEKPGADEPGRKSGWINLGRMRVEVVPGSEWRQMAREAWRLQKEYFWTPDMSGVDWDGVWNRYEPLLDRIGSRSEFSDLIWEMQGELGTSHAYEFGGDYRPEPAYHQGFLGADYQWDEDAQGYRVARIVEGTPGDEGATSPLRAPGVLVETGDVLVAINGNPLRKDWTPQQALVNQAGCEVTLTIRRGDEVRNVVTRALRSEFPARYREWVERNRRRVHEVSGGRVGYVHIPDMMAPGYSEFHRLFLSESEKDALIVDVRFNRGGHVSQLILEKLARKRVGYDVPRWGQPEPYPSHAVGGPLVMITNQFAGSDGDIVSHCFKLMGLGPLIGTRTWGGVIGIGPHNPLADGGMTTQPEYSFWFKDVGWGVENYGTDPDIEVHITPQDYAAGRDPQLDRALSEIMTLLEQNPPLRPDLENRPKLPLPRTLPDPPDAGGKA